VIPAALSFGEVLTPLFFYVVIVAYMAFVLVSAWQFSRRPEPGRSMRFINLTLVPLGVLVALVGVLAASFNAFSQQEGTPSTIWAIVMVALGLGASSFLLAFEGALLERRTTRHRVTQLEPDRDHGATGRPRSAVRRAGAPNLPLKSPILDRSDQLLRGPECECACR